MKICLVTFYSLYGDNPLTRLSDLLSIFEPLAEEIILITEGVQQGALPSRKLRVVSIKYSGRSRFIFIKALQELAAQLNISWHLLKAFWHQDCIYWGINADTLVLPVIMTKLNRKKCILFIGGTFSKTKGLTHKKGFFDLGEVILARIARTMENTCYALCDVIVANSIGLLRESLSKSQLCKYRAKSYPLACPVRFVDINLFRPFKPLTQRTKTVGYVGRLSREKGVANFLKAVPLVLGRQLDLEFTVAGYGPQQEEIMKMVEEGRLSSVVKLTGWVPHAELPEYLNEIQLLILPSITEGLPTVALEAMACGTPVLATPVGGVPELIRDGYTGFILQDNSPETIAKGIIRALNHPDLEKITRNARALIEREYTYQATVERFRKLFASLNKGG